MSSGLVGFSSFPRRASPGVQGSQVPRARHSQEGQPTVTGLLLHWKLTGTGRRLGCRFLGSDDDRVSVCCQHLIYSACSSARWLLGLWWLVQLYSVLKPIHISNPEERQNPVIFHQSSSSSSSSSSSPGCRPRLSHSVAGPSCQPVSHPRCAQPQPSSPIHPHPHPIPSHPSIHLFRRPASGPPRVSPSLPISAQ